MRKLILIIWTLTLSMYAQADINYPKLKLDNGVLQVSIYLPDADHGFYRGTRFDWSGIIERVDYDGHRFYAPLHTMHNPTGHDFVSGPAEEFAMFNPMGFAEAEVGESFVKIGVGLLQKTEATEYLFHADYKIIQAGQWQIKSESDRIIFSQQLIAERGWAYDYQKTIQLEPGKAGFVIQHLLENTGSKTIDINHYNHNFTLIDDLPYGPDYQVEFPFESAQPVSINELAWFRGNEIEVKQPLGQNSLWAQVFEGKDPGFYNAARIKNKRSGAVVEFKGDTPITRMVFWAVERAASPEPFIQLIIKPGEAQQWSSYYRFSVEDK